MKSFEGLNYYDILKVPANSSAVTIRQAFRDALALYEKDSLVTYSLFSDEERADILKAVEEAFLTLVDENKRAAYNRMLIDTGQMDASILFEKEQKKPISLFRPKDPPVTDDLAERVRKKSAEKETKDLVNEVLAKNSVSGNDLKRLRKVFGIEIAEIYEITKISVKILKMIEGDQFQSLPADIYLKFFLRSYAEILQIDPKRIVDGYLKNISLVKKGE